jgi:Leucine-rich repeat (LRR) protein
MKIDFSWKSEKDIIINNPKDIIECNISWCNLKSIPNNIFNLENLKILKCFENNIDNLNYDFNKISKLESIELGNCYIKNINNNILELSNLEIFNIAYNGLETLPKDINKLSNLKSFELGSNNIKQLPKNFYNLKSLVYLNLSCNKIDKLDEEFINLKNLQMLIIDSRVVDNSKNIIDTIKQNNPQLNIFNELNEQI